MAKELSAWNDISAGTKAAFSLPVASRADGTRIELPVLVARSKAPGKTLLISAGVHGDEFEGMAAIRQVYRTLEPERLTGTFVAVPIANPPSYEAGLRTNPDDRQDMARIFPGDPAGTVTEQLAYALTHSFIRHADLYCDLHSAGQYYRMPAMTGYQLRPEPLLSIQRAAAKAFGLPIIWGTPGLPGRSLSAAGEYGVPSIYAEITGEGRCRTADVEQYVHGIRQLLAYLGISGEPLARHEPQWLVEDDRPNTGYLQVQNRAPVGGFFEAEVAVWDRVEQDQPIGTICDAVGVCRHVVKATHSGRIVFLRTYSRILAGEPVCTVLETDQ